MAVRERKDPVGETAVVTEELIPAPAKELPQDIVPAAAPKTESPKEKPAATVGGFCVYLGPTIRNIIQSGTVYKGTKADALNAMHSAAREIPLIKSLLVSGATLATARIKVKTPGNLLYENYKRLAAGQKE